MFEMVQWMTKYLVITFKFQGQKLRILWVWAQKYVCYSNRTSTTTTNEDKNSKRYQFHQAIHNKIMDKSKTIMSD